MNQLKCTLIFLALLTAQRLSAANFGYKIVSGAQKENLDGLLIKENRSDHELMEKTQKTIALSPELIGYHLGLSVFFQPMPEVPFSVGAFITRRDLGSRQENLELRGHQGGVELNLWLPHESVEPYILIVGGFWGRTDLRGEYEDSQGSSNGYGFSGQNRLVKGGVGLRLHSTKQLAAYFQVDTGVGLSVGNMSYNESESPQQALLDGKNEGGGLMTNIILQSRVQSVSIGIDWM